MEGVATTAIRDVASCHSTIRDVASMSTDHEITQISTREQYCGSGLRILLALLSHANPKSCVNLVVSYPAATQIPRNKSKQILCRAALHVNRLRSTPKSCLFFRATSFQHTQRPVFKAFVHRVPNYVAEE